VQLHYKMYFLPGGVRASASLESNRRGRGHFLASAASPFLPEVELFCFVLPLVSPHRSPPSLPRRWALERDWA